MGMVSQGCLMCGVRGVCTTLPLLWLTAVLVLPVRSLRFCTSWQVETMATVNYTRLSGVWHVIGRQDVGVLDNELWNTKVKVVVKRRSGTGKMPVWFNHPRGCCTMTLEMWGRDNEGRCQGRRYMWGCLEDSQPGCFKHKLIGTGHYSMLYVLDTDYEGFAVLAHCRSKILNGQLSCDRFNVLLMKRRVAEDVHQTVASFPTARLNSRLNRACSGHVHFRSARVDDWSGCDRSAVQFYTPGVYEIHCL